MALLIIKDDTRISSTDPDPDSFTFGPPDWTINTLNPWFNGTGHVPQPASYNTNSSQLFMTFNGTIVAFFGITPSASNSQILSVSIDGSQPTNTSYNDPNPPSYRQWYQSPTLKEGSHNISLRFLAGTSLDFAIVTAGNDTPLAGQTAIVDNDDTAITFQGNWTRSTASFNSSQVFGLPFQNTTQETTTIGDNLTFRFNGQSAAIYGVFDWSTLGLITLSFTLDGSSLSKTFQVTSTTSQFRSQLGHQPNLQFFAYNFLTPGNHTLVVNVTDCVNQTFSFDYITFEPSFSSLATMPNLTSLTSGASQSGSSNRLSTGAIIGIIIALLAFVVCGFFAWKRRSKKKLSIGVNPFLPTQRDSGTFPLNTRPVSSTSGISNGTMRIVSNNYTPVHIADPDALGRPNTALDPTRQTGLVGEHDIVEDELCSPPSYDESNRMNPVTIR